MENLFRTYKNKRKVWLGICFLFLIGLFVVLINQSYALWSVNVEKPNQMKIVAGTLQYRLDSTRLTNNKITIAANKEEEVKVEVVSLNTVSSKYAVYYEGTLPSGVEIGYIETAAEGPIGSINSKIPLTFMIRNKSSNTVTITLGSQGSLPNGEVILSTNRNKIGQATLQFEKTYAYTGSEQTFTAPYSGYYKIELWGAQGGSNVGLEGSLAGNVGGLGAYSTGTIYLNQDETMYIVVGGQGKKASSLRDTSSRGYNGGGFGGYVTACYQYCMNGGGGGGGATDVRLTMDLKSRIMVAGGGGGAANWYSPNSGGAAGNLIGRNGREYRHTGTASYINAIGGQQSFGGAGGIGEITATSGIFGQGADTAVKGFDAAESTYGGGGGGGYYGGGSGGLAASVVGSGAGGSSYISGYAGVNSITSSGMHTDNTLHSSGKYFIAGNMLENNNTGNGKARITYVDTTQQKKNTKLKGVRYIKDCVNGNTGNAGNHWRELQAMSNGTNLVKDKDVIGTSPEYSAKDSYQYIVDGKIDNGSYGGALSVGLQCVIIDLGETYDLDEVVVWHYFDDGRSYNNHTLSVGPTNQSGTASLATVLINNRSGIIETSNGFRFNAWQ